MNANEAALWAHRAASDLEQVAWVDEHDQVLGSRPRAELRELGLIGRCTFILLFNRQGLLCVHQRTLSKALYPGYWDVCAGGMVGAGEAYAASARRELAEELGITDALLTDHGGFYYGGPESRLWCRVYHAVSDAPLRLQPEEVAQARFMSLEAVAVEQAYTPFCPDSLRALAHYLTRRKSTAQ